MPKKKTYPSAIRKAPVETPEDLECGCKRDEDLNNPQCAGHQAIAALVAHLREQDSTEWACQRLQAMQEQVERLRAELKRQMDQRDLLVIAVVESELVPGSVVGQWLGWSRLVPRKLVRWSRAGYPPLSASSVWREGTPKTASSRPRGSGVPLGKSGGTPGRGLPKEELKRRKAARAKARAIRTKAG